MKTPAHFRFAATALLIAIIPTIVFGQGPLTPPAAPSPTMKTLDQVEARIIVNAVNTPGDASNSFIISQPGSYYLTGNLQATSGKNGVSIQADGVTLDLNGFALIGEATGSGIGVNLPNGRQNLCLRNGTIRGWPGDGVAAQLASSSELERLRVTNNVGNGVRVGNESSVRDCVMTGNTDTGLRAGDRVQVVGCVADVNGAGLNLGDNVLVIDCLVSRSLLLTTGIRVGDNSTVSRSTVSFNAGVGITLGQGSSAADCSVGFNEFGITTNFGCTVRNCTLRRNSDRGIDVAGRCHIVGNTCDANGLVASAYGINVSGSGSRIEGNTCTNNWGGISCVGVGNLVVRNSAHLNGPGDNFNVTFGSATIIDVTVSTGFLSDQPWANFFY